MIKYICIAFFLFAYVTAAQATPHPSIRIDGRPVNVSPAPVIRKGRIYIPVETLRKIGLYVKYESAPRLAYIAWPESDEFINIEPKRAWVVYEGPKIREQTLDKTPFIYRGALMAPIRVIAQEWKRSLAVGWNHRTKTLNIYRLDRNWLRWRKKNDLELRKSLPNCYDIPA